MKFTELTAMMREDGDRFAIAIPESWMQGRTTYGGLSAAMCLEAAERRFDDLPPLRSAMVSFLGPCGGQVRADARALRSGKSVTYVECGLEGDAGLATRAVFAFGAARDSVFNAVYTPTPNVPGPEDCDEFFPSAADDLRPAFTKCFEARLASGGRPFTGTYCHDNLIWVRHKDEAARGALALLALADMPPPAVLPMFKEFAPVSTMTWMANFLIAQPQTRDGWWLLQSKADDVREGYQSQDMYVWNRDGDLVIAGRQNVAIFL